MGHNGGGPPDKTQTLDSSHFSTADWDKAVSDLYQQGYTYFFTVGPWVTFGGYSKPK